MMGVAFHMSLSWKLKGGTLQKGSESSSVVVFLSVFENRHESGNLIILVVSEC